MKECFVDLKDIYLSYPSAPYNALSFKEYVFCLMTGKKPQRLIHDVQALKGITISFSEGERVGIIGSNGSGKSTLLKTIAGIYPLHSGRIDVQGDIRSLFELSLGFDFEATGRENIMYRGLLLGEHPDVIANRMEKIISFAEIGEFIDYPVKTYSAGMQVRLAFAISTTIRGDILLLDEIIGAGDSAFMMKAKRRIQELVDQAKILLLVSHDLEAVCDICNRVIWLNKGHIIADGEPETVIELYRKSVER